MRIKPKKPKLMAVRRGILGVVGLGVVLFLLLSGQKNDSLVEEESSGLPETATTAVPEGYAAPGELDWEYPPGWVDYSDLPALETLGDEAQPGLSNWRYLLVNGLDRSNYLRESYYPDMTYVEAGYSFQTRAVEDLKAFIAAARAEGYTVSISRTYMSYSDQRVRFNGMASTIYDQGELTLAEAEDRLADPCVRKQLELLRLRATHPAFGADSVGTVKAEGNGLTLAWQKGTDRVALEVDFRDGAWRIIQ